MAVLTVLVFLVVVLAVPQTRRLLRRLVPVEVSLEPGEGIAAKYCDFPSSRGFNVEEAVEVKGGEARVIVSGGALPRVRDEDHSALLISDFSFTPSRKEIRLLRELSDLNSDLAVVSRLVKTYFDETGIRTVGVLVCDEAAENFGLGG